jgi:hypothetical protein
MIRSQEGKVMGLVGDRIEEWERLGLIDAALAERLRGTEADRPVGAPIAPSPLATDENSAAVAGPTSLGSFFGPSVSIGEMFGYLGVGFLLGAWTAFLARVAGTTDRDAILTFGTGFAAFAMVVVGAVLVRGPRRVAQARRRRGAGAALIAATVFAAGAAAFGVQIAALQGPATGLVIAGVAVVAAGVFRICLPAVTTQLGLLGALTGLAGSVVTWLDSFVVGPFGAGGSCCFDTPAPATPVVVVVFGAVTWLVAALVIGIVGIAEARRSSTDPASARRAVLTRFWAGIVAVGGLATSVNSSGSLGNDQYGRLVAPWIGEAAILVLVAVLVERAIRRESAAFVVAAAIGLIVALTDFNFSYLAQSTDVGLLIEGAILLLVGFGADRLRRRLVRSRPAGTGPSGGGPITHSVLGSTPDEAAPPA